MNEHTSKLFARVAEKLGWTNEEGLDTVEKKVCITYLMHRHFTGS